MLVDHGRLVGFLAGRAPVLGKHPGNGHARAEAHERPISRMAILVVEVEGAITEQEL